MTYVVISIVWAVLGFLAGYVIGRMAREVHEVKQAIKPDTEEGSTDEHH